MEREMRMWESLCGRMGFMIGRKQIGMYCWDHGCGVYQLIFSYVVLMMATTV